MLKHVQWSDRYSVGVAAMDTQHRQLFKLVNELIDMINKGATGSHLHMMSSFFFMQLFSYVTTHFQDEADLIRSHNFSGAAAHIQQHNTIHAEVRAFHNRYEQLNNDQDRVAKMKEITQYMIKWLDHHIRVEDKAYGKYLNSIGIT